MIWKMNLCVQVFWILFPSLLGEGSKPPCTLRRCIFAAIGTLRSGCLCGSPLERCIRRLVKWESPVRGLIEAHWQTQVSEDRERGQRTNPWRTTVFKEWWKEPGKGLLGWRTQENGWVKNVKYKLIGNMGWVREWQNTLIGGIKEGMNKWREFPCFYIKMILPYLNEHFPT